MFSIFLMALVLLMASAKQPRNLKGQHQNYRQCFHEKARVRKIQLSSVENKTYVHYALDLGCMRSVRKKFHNDDDITGQLIATHFKYSFLEQALASGIGGVLFTADVEQSEDLLQFVVGDTDVIVNPFACYKDSPVSEGIWFDDPKSLDKDVYSGFWSQEEKMYMYCSPTWWLKSAAVDPRLFYISNSQGGRELLREILAEIESIWAQPHEDSDDLLDETSLLSRLVLYRPDKYLTVRSFAKGLFADDYCIAKWKYSRHLLAARLKWRMTTERQLGKVTARASAASDGYSLSLLEKSIQGAANPPGGTAGDYCAHHLEDKLCDALASIAWRDLPTTGQRTIALIVHAESNLPKPFFGARPSDVPRLDFAEHTLCGCINSDTCEKCRQDGLRCWYIAPWWESLPIGGLANEPVEHFYRYYLTKEILMRGYGVLSYHHLIAILRSPWPDLSDQRFDFFGFSDGHTAEWASGQRAQWALTYERACLNGEFWFVRPTPLGLELFRRLIAFIEYSFERRQMFFHQAMLSTAIFTLRTSEKVYGRFDVRYRILPESKYFNGKSTVQYSDVRSVCNTAVVVSSTYYCPVAFMFFETDRYDAVQWGWHWLSKFREMCNLPKPPQLEYSGVKCHAK